MKTLANASASEKTPQKNKNMFKQRSVKIAVIASALFTAWWLWPSHGLQESRDQGAESDQSQAGLVSSIQPITQASAANESPVTDTIIGDNSSSAPEVEANRVREKIALRFAKVNQMISDDQASSAISELKVMIDEFPSVIEPYINLAALYSKSNQLDLARQTLNRGIEANQNTALLFQSRQTVLGVQAAHAYKQALNEPVTSTEPVLLPFISTIDVPSARVSNTSTENGKLQDELVRLKNQLSSAQLERDRLEQTKSNLEKNNAELEQINGKLELEKTSFVQNKTSFDQYKANLEQVKSSLEYDNSTLAQDKNSLEQANKSLEEKNMALLETSETLKAEKQTLQQSEKTLSDQKSTLEQDKLSLVQTVDSLQKSNADLVAKTKELELAKVDLAHVNTNLEKGERLAANQEAANKTQFNEMKRLQTQLDASERALNVSQQAVEQSQQASSESQAEVAKLRKLLADNAVIAGVDVNAGKEHAVKEAPEFEPSKAPDVKPRVADSTSKQSVQHVIALVKSWAADWTAQNVRGYVSHYSDNYTPPRGSLTHQQWLDQRQIRLTNKTFINVEVSDFKSQRRGEQLVVTFSQHYRSNTVDDKIVKRLIFTNDGDDWSQAKIVDEVVVSR